MHPDTELRTRALSKAMEHPDQFLAAVLTELSDEALATATGVDSDRVWQLRLKRRPRVAYWASDVRELATSLGIDPLRLAQLLAQVGIRPGN